MFNDFFPWKPPVFTPLSDEELRFFVEFFKPCFVFERRAKEVATEETKEKAPLP